MRPALKTPPILKFFYCVLVLCGGIRRYHGSLSMAMKGLIGYSLVCVEIAGKIRI